MEARAILLFIRFPYLERLYRANDGEYFTQLDECEQYIAYFLTAGSYTIVERITPLPEIPTPTPENTPIWVYLSDPSNPLGLGYDAVVSDTEVTIDEMGEVTLAVNNVGAFKKSNWIRVVSQSGDTIGQYKLGRIVSVAPGEITVFFTNYQGIAGLTSSDWAITLTGDKGDNGLIWKGAWSNLVTYNIDDAVTSGGSSYRSKVASNLNHVVTNTTYWELLAQKGTEWEVSPVVGNIQKVDGEGKIASKLKIFDSVASLKTVEGDIGDLAQLTGYINKGDGGGREYYWDDEATSSDNGGTIIAVTGVATGRWKAIVSNKENVVKWGAIANGLADNTAIVQSVIDAYGANKGTVVIPPNCNYNYSALSVGFKIVIEDQANNRIIMAHTAIEPSLHNNHLLIRSTDVNGVTRYHIEPNGYPVGTATKLDLMLDPYEIDAANYRLANWYTKTFNPADSSTTKGNNGVVVFGAKCEGDNFGIYPTMHFGFSDDGAASAVPLKLYYFDTADTEWRNQMLGAWRTGKPVVVDDYMLASNKLYRATTAGTTGVTKPTHSSGTVTDGVVSWNFIRDFAANAGTIKGVVVLGERDDMPKFGLPTVRTQIARDMAIWNGVKVRFIDQNNVSAWVIYDEGNSQNLYIENSDASCKVRFSSDGKFLQINGMAISFTAATAADLDTTPTIKGIRTLNFNNASATSVTKFDDGIQYQEILVRSSNSNTTLVHGTHIKLKGAINRVITADEVVHFQMNGGGTVANEIS